MKINRQFQDLHVAGGGAVDWALKQQVERDVCLLYRQLADYSYIMGDLYWGSVYTLPYWEFLDWAELDDHDRVFLRDGCLVMLLTAAWEQIDGTGGWLGPHIPACRAAIGRLQPEAGDARELVRVTQLALTAAEAGPAEQPELFELSRWVHVRYVRGYFIRTADDFRSNPYFGGPGAG